MFLKYLPLYTLLLTLIIPGCKSDARLAESTDAYYLEYEIKYLEEMAGDVPTKMLPRKMEAYYSRHYVYTRIDGFFNQFTLIQIADLRRKKVATLLDFFGTHVSYSGDPGELPAGIREPDNMELNHTKDTATIGGFLSEKIEVVSANERFDIYCTPEIRVRHANISTPYQTVNHPLTAFRIQLSHLKMELTCQEFEFKTIESEIFKIPDHYKAVNRAAMEEIINNLFTKD